MCSSDLQCAEAHALTVAEIAERAGRAESRLLDDAGAAQDVLAEAGADRSERRARVEDQDSSFVEERGAGRGGGRSGGELGASDLDEYGGDVSAFGWHTVRRSRPPTSRGKGKGKGKSKDRTRDELRSILMRCDCALLDQRVSGDWQYRLHSASAGLVEVGPVLAARADALAAGNEMAIQLLVDSGLASYASDEGE